MRLPILGWGRRVLTIAAAILMTAGTATADPLIISSVNALYTPVGGAFTSIDLAANLGAVLAGEQVYYGTVPRAVVTFEVFLPSMPAGNTLRATFQLPTSDQLPFSNLVQDAPIGAIPGGYVFGMDFPLLYQPEPMSITLSNLHIIPGSPPAAGSPESFTYTFSVVQPVPEPASVLLCGAALGAALVNRRRLWSWTRR
jgi:hypothetical protein